MIIQVNYGDIPKSDALDAHVRDRVEHVLQHWASQITRVEVHLKDDKGSGQSENDVRCMMEVRLAGRQPMAIEERGREIYAVVSDTAEKVQTAVRRTIEKHRDR